MASDYDPFVRVATRRDETLVAGHRAESLRESGKYRGRPLQFSEVALERVTLVSGFVEEVLASAELVRVSDSEWVVEHVWVHPDAREAGLGDTLMQASIDHARRHGGTRIRGSAQPGDRAMKNLFERHGLVAETIIVARDL